MREIIILGVGSNIKAVVAAAQDAGFTVRAIYDDNSARWGDSIFDVPIVGPLSRAISAGVPAVMAFDDPWKRKTITEEMDLAWATVVHPTSFINPSAVVGQGAVILDGVVIQPAVVVGRHVVIAANATIAHDCVLDDFVQIDPGVDLAGAVHVAQGAHLQIGAVVIPNVRVGSWTVVGPRAAVIRDVPDDTFVAGLPARPVEDEEPPSGGGWHGGENALTILLGLTSALGAAQELLGRLYFFRRKQAPA